MNETSLPASARLASCFAAFCLGLAALGATAGQVEVSWVEPDQFADAGRRVVDRERTIGALGDHLKGWSRLLPDGQTLRLEVLDLNLAGEMSPTAGMKCASCAAGPTGRR